MRLTILVDNNAGHDLAGEWGLSFLIEADGKKVLFDTGGFHLKNLKSDDPKLTGASRYFKELKSGQIHPCHCTDLHSKFVLTQVAKVNEVYSGLFLEYY